MKTGTAFAFVAPFLLGLILLNLKPAIASAQGTAFSYQGQLNAGGAPANGNYDIAFTLFATNSGGAVVAGPVTNSATAVNNGLFTATIDFGAGVFTGAGYWLDIRVSPSGSNTFTELSPRQPLLSAPYAVMANSASNLLGTLQATQLVGTIQNVLLPANPSFSGTVTANTFSGNALTATTATNALNLGNVSVSNIINAVDIIVTTNGFTIPGGFVEEPSPGMALQSALNFYVSHSLSFATINGLIFSSNTLGGTFELGPADANNPFYLPGGFVISNQYATASWRITGRGVPNTVICGDSNVLTFAQMEWGGLPKFEIDHCTLCFSNYASKAVAVYLQGLAFLNFHDNFVVPLIAELPSNYYVSWAEGGTLGTSIQYPYSPGMIGLVPTGGTGEQWIHNNVFSGEATAILCLAEHERLQNNEYQAVSAPYNSGYANRWSATDRTVLFQGDGYAPIYGADIAIGAAIIMAGQGDFQEIGDKMGGCAAGVYFKGAYTDLYGPNLMDDVHFEALQHPAANDIVVGDFSDGQTFPSRVVAINCTDQQNGDQSVTAWSLNTATYVESQTFTNNTGLESFVSEENTCLSPESGGYSSTPIMMYKVNNQTIMSIDSGNDTIQFANWEMSVPVAVSNTTTYVPAYGHVTNGIVTFTTTPP